MVTKAVGVPREGGVKVADDGRVGERGGERGVGGGRDERRFRRHMLSAMFQKRSIRQRDSAGGVSDIFE